MTVQDRRLELHNLLLSIMKNGNVYHQPPESKKLQYPCIVYERDKGYEMHADNSSYHRRLRYTITLIDKKSVSEFMDPIMDLPFCTYDRHFANDDLNHDVFNLYF